MYLVWLVQKCEFLINLFLVLLRKDVDKTGAVDFYTYREEFGWLQSLSLVWLGAFKGLGSVRFNATNVRKYTKAVWAPKIASRHNENSISCKML